MIQTTNGTPLVVWMAKNPGAVDEIIERSNRWESARVQLTSVLGPQSAGTAVTVARDNVIINLPLRFSQTISAPAGGATIDTECRDALSKLLAALTQVGQNPG